MAKKDEAFIKRLLATFRVEAAEHIAAISSGLIELEQSSSPERQAEIVEAIFRESHSMKGAARAVNLSVIESVCQSLEGVLSALKRKEIMLSRNLLDLLHRTINGIQPLLSEDAVPEKTLIRDLISELDNASAVSGSETGKEVSAGKQTVSRAPAPDHSLTSSGPALSVARTTSDTVRISKQKLDSLLLQAEGLLSVKQLMAQRTAELRKVVTGLEELKTEWARIRPDVRKAAVAAQKKGDGKILKKMLEFLDEKGEDIAGFYSSIASTSKATEHDRRTMSTMADNLLEDLKTVSMLPFSSMLEIMPKVVRDLSHDQGKDVSLLTRGGEIEVDRRILDEIREPLIHLVRNCIDHGIETPEERVASHKPAAGTISLSASLREGKSFEITVSDDGTGVDTSKIANSAVRLGILSEEEAGGADEARLLAQIFRSGVTSSRIITDISGRGLGLAIVQEKVEKLGGSAFCETSRGKGTTFRIVLPLTIATFRGVLVRIDEHLFLIPITGLDRTLRVGRDEIRTVENRETIAVGNQTVPFVPLRAVLELPRREKGKTDSEVVQAAVLGVKGQRIAFGVDDILNEQEVLVKDLGKQLARVRNVAGATVLGSGEVVPVLNVSDLLKSAIKVSPGAGSDLISRGTPLKRKSVLVVEDSITARTLVKTILEGAGYDVRTAVDGLDALTLVRTEPFDIVVSDVDMPRMNGLDLTARIRADSRLGDLPVILVTALESREDRERGAEVGANAYIVKSSFDQSNLLEAISRLI